MKRARPPSETLERLERQLVLPLFDALVQKGKRGQRSKDRSNHPGRAALPAHLERVVVRNEVPADKRVCLQCGAAMKTVGFSCCEMLDVVPARIVVVQRKDETVGCPNDDTIVSAPVPPQIVERGKLGETLLVEAVADKYLEHMPIERQCTRFARAGIDVAPQTLGRGVCAAIDLLDPVAKAIEERTRAPGLLGTDASAIPILDPTTPAGIRSGAMWCWTNARWVTFFYSPSGDSDSVRRFLKNDLVRVVQCDGTSVTTFLERAGGKRPGCWSHGRRRLVDAARSGDQIELEGLHIIARIFAVERAATLAGDTAEERRARREEHTRPVTGELRTWIDDKRAVIPPKTPLGRGLGYLHRQWSRLLLFLEDGNIEATNNRRERELRRLVLGRKNWLGKAKLSADLCGAIQSTTKWRTVEEDAFGRPATQVAEISFAREAWRALGYPFRVVAMRTRERDNGKQIQVRSDLDYTVQAFVTNDWTTDAEEIAFEYDGRAEIEPAIGELKSGWGIGKIPSQDFHANHAVFLLKLLAHNVMLRFVRWTAPHLSTWRVPWLRRALINIPGRLLRSGRRWSLRVPPKSSVRLE